MKIAEEQLGIPQVLAPSDMASSSLDELSCLTYISYFVRNDKSPGTERTLERVRQLLPQRTVRNFAVKRLFQSYALQKKALTQTDWNDGILLSELVHNLGGRVLDYPRIPSHPTMWIANLHNAMQAGRKLNVIPQLTAEEMSMPDVDQLSVMSYISQVPFQRVINTKELFCSSFNCTTKELWHRLSPEDL